MGEVNEGEMVTGMNVCKEKRKFVLLLKQQRGGKWETKALSKGRRKNCIRMKGL